METVVKNAVLAKGKSGKTLASKHIECGMDLSASKEDKLNIMKAIKAALGAVKSKGGKKSGASDTTFSLEPFKTFIRDRLKQKHRVTDNCARALESVAAELATQILLASEAKKNEEQGKVVVKERHVKAAMNDAFLGKLCGVKVVKDGKAYYGMDPSFRSKYQKKKAQAGGGDDWLEVGGSPKKRGTGKKRKSKAAKVQTAGKISDDAVRRIGKRAGAIRFRGDVYEFIRSGINTTVTDVTEAAVIIANCRGKKVLSADLTADALQACGYEVVNPYTCLQRFRARKAGNSDTAAPAKTSTSSTRKKTVAAASGSGTRKTPRVAKKGGSDLWFGGAKAQAQSSERRTHPGTRARSHVGHYQKSESERKASKIKGGRKKLLSSSSVRSLMKESAPNHRISPGALKLVQDATENHYVGVMNSAVKYTLYKKQQTVTAEGLAFVTNDSSCGPCEGPLR